MKCYFCNCQMPEVIDEAIDAGWIPSFWHGDVECDGQVCPKCNKEFLRFNSEDGVFELGDCNQSTFQIEDLVKARRESRQRMADLVGQITVKVTK